MPRLQEEGEGDRKIRPRGLIVRDWSIPGSQEESGQRAGTSRTGGMAESTPLDQCWGREWRLLATDLAAWGSLENGLGQKVHGSSLSSYHLQLLSCSSTFCCVGIPSCSHSPLLSRAPTARFVYESHLRAVSILISFLLSCVFLGFVCLFLPFLTV